LLINLFSLPSPCLFIWCLGHELHLTCGSPGVWALGPKLQFYNHTWNHHLKENTECNYHPFKFFHGSL
jgi:hypothetical protein